MKKHPSRKSTQARRATFLLTTSILLAGNPFSLNASHDYNVPIGEPQTESQNLTDAGGDTLNKSGGGTLILTGSNTYSGSTNVTEGTLILSGSGAQINQSGSINVTSATFNIENLAHATSGSITTTGGLLSVSGSNTLLSSGTTTLVSGDITVSSGSEFVSTVTQLQSGTFTVKGTGSHAKVGYVRSTADILVAEGGKLTTSVAYLGFGDNNEIRVTGEGSTWHAGGQLNIGKFFDGVETTFGSGSVVLSDGGHILVGSTENPHAMLLTGTARSSIYIGGGEGEAATKAGTLKTFAVVGYQNAGGAIIFNHTHGTTEDLSDPYVFSTKILDNIQVNQLSGVTVLDAENNYSGGTNVYGGKLIVENYISGSSEVFGGQLVISGSTDGGIVVNSGSATINGWVSGDVSSQGTGLVGGSGVIGGSLFNAGVVNPGNSPGTLTVTGNYTQAPSGTLVIEIDGANHDRLVVSGTAFLDGGLSIHAINRQSSGKPIEILNAAGGVEGSFSSLESFGLLDFNLEYLSNSVVLSFSETSILDFAKLRGLNPNEREVARALDRANRRGKLGPLLDRLYAMTLDEVESTLTLLSPEQLAQIFQIGFANAQTQYNNLERRMSDVRDGSCGFSTNGLALSNAQGTLNYDGMPLANERNGLTFAGWDGKSLVGKTAVAPLLQESRWGFFATGTGEWADVETTAQARGSEFTTGGVTIGADYRVSNNLVIGIAGGYANSNSKLSNDGKIEVNSGRGSLYATAFGNGFYLNTAVGGAYNSYDTRRGTLGGKANGSTEGGEFNALLGGGYDYRTGGFSIGPVASLQYTYLGLNSFEENGSDAPLRFSSQSQDSLKSSLGLKASYAWNIGGIVIRPEVRAQWQHEFLDSTASLESSFVGGAGVFTVNGTQIGRDSLLLDAGVTVQFNPTVSVFAYYTGEIGRTNYSSNSVNGGVRINF